MSPLAEGCVRSRATAATLSHARGLPFSTASGFFDKLVLLGGGGQGTGKAAYKSLTKDLKWE